MAIFTSSESNLNIFCLWRKERNKNIRKVSYRKDTKPFTAHKLYFTQNSTTYFHIELTQAKQVQSTSSIGSQKYYKTSFSFPLFNPFTHCSSQLEKILLPTSISFFSIIPVCFLQYLHGVTADFSSATPSTWTTSRNFLAY